MGCEQQQQEQIIRRSSRRHLYTMGCEEQQQIIRSSRRHLYTMGCKEQQQQQQQMIRRSSRRHLYTMGCEEQQQQQRKWRFNPALAQGKKSTFSSVKQYIMIIEICLNFPNFSKNISKWTLSRLSQKLLNFTWCLKSFCKKPCKVGRSGRFKFKDLKSSSILFLKCKSWMAA